MFSTSLTIVHLYPEQMNLYGDTGNIKALINRAKWRNINITVKTISIGDKKRLNDADFIFLGGGQDKDQLNILTDLMRRKKEIKACYAKNVPILAICGGYQLLGKYYQTASNEKIPGLELLNIWTIAGEKRMIGNIAILSKAGGSKRIIIGFENHAGRTFLGKDVQPLGRVLKGFGNNGRDRTEGVLCKNVIGTYLHGPVLPANPYLTDFCLARALKVKYKNVKLTPLADTFEKKAYYNFLKKMKLKIVE